MNIINEKSYKNSHKVTIACPLCDLKITLTSTSRAEALQKADELWVLHKQQSHGDNSGEQTMPEM